MPQFASDASPIESLPHLINKISLMWGSPELNDFIDTLILDSRDGARQGFPTGVGNDLVFLAETNVILRAIHLAQKLQIPFRDALRKIEAADHERDPRQAFNDPSAGVSRDLAYHDRGADRRIQPSFHKPSPERRSGSERRHEESGGFNFLNLLKAAAYFAVIALVGKLFWPHLSKLIG